MHNHGLDAWLGDTELTEDQHTQFAAAASEIAARYPDADDETERDIALSVALQMILGEADSVQSLGVERTRLRTEAHLAEVRLYERIRWALAAGESENGLANRAGLDRMTIRKLAGKR